MDSIALYVHVPWCVKKCPYCDFNSHQVKQAIDSEQYLQALKQDFEQDWQKVSKRSLSSIFIGGGTPSIMPVSFYEGLLKFLSDVATLDDDIEITLEANPGTAEAEKFSGFRKAGINRLSLGFQSLNDDALIKLGRIHDAGQAIKAYEMAQSAGFNNINIDLMFALPGQNLPAAMGDLQNVIDLQPQHISWYQLTLEPNTAFYASPPPAIPEDDAAWEIQLAGRQILKNSGYRQYEISAYASEGRTCRHNLNYWQYGDYLGIGAGAHGKFRNTKKDFIRNSKKRSPNDFLKGKYLSKSQILGHTDLTAEYFMNRLRLGETFDLTHYEKQTGLKGDDLSELLDKAIEKELLESQLNETGESIYRVTPLGHQYLNELISLFL